MCFAPLEASLQIFESENSKSCGQEAASDPQENSVAVDFGHVELNWLLEASLQLEWVGSNLEHGFGRPACCG